MRRKSFGAQLYWLIMFVNVISNVPALHAQSCPERRLDIRDRIRLAEGSMRIDTTNGYPMFIISRLGLVAGVYSSQLSQLVRKEPNAAYSVWIASRAESIDRSDVAYWFPIGFTHRSRIVAFDSCISEVTEEFRGQLFYIFIKRQTS